MAPSTSSLVNDGFRYDCFISYRRSDGGAVAWWLRRHLLTYKLPPTLRSGRTNKLTVFLDTVYERASDDFFERNIVPAITASRFLVVVATPDANKKRADGTPNWVTREIEQFLETPQRSNIIVVRGGGQWTDPLPGDLLDSFPNVDIIDARYATGGLLRRLLDRIVTPSEVFTLVAPLFGIDQQNMPVLRREEAKRTRLRIIATATVAITVLILISLLGGYGWFQKIKTDKANQIALARYLSSQSRIIAADSARRREEALLLAIEGYRREPSAVTAGALHELLDVTPLPVARLKHEGGVNAVYFTPDERYLASASDDGSVRIWNYSTSEVVSQLRLDRPARKLEFGPNENELTAVFRRLRSSGSRKSPPDNGQVVSWRWPDNVVTNRFDPPNPVYFLLFDPNRKELGGVTPEGIWHPLRSSAETLNHFSSPIKIPMTLSKSRQLLAAVQSNKIVVFDAVSGKQLQTIDLPDDGVPKALAFGPNESQLLIGQRDGKTGLWNWRTKTKIVEHDGYSDPMQLEVSPDGKYVAEISTEMYFSLWMTQTGKDVYVVDSQEELKSGTTSWQTVFSANSQFLAIGIGDWSVRVIRIAGDQSNTILHFTPESGITGLALNRAGNLLATADDDGWVTLWRLERGRSAAEFLDTGIVTSSSGDGRLALVGKKLRVVDQGLKTITEPSLDTSEAREVRFSPSGRFIALGRKDGRVAVVDVTTAAVQGWRDSRITADALPAPTGESEETRRDVVDLKFSADEKKLIVVRIDGVSEIDLPGWRITPHQMEHISFFVDFSPDGRLLSSKETSGPTHIYSLESFSEIWTIGSKAFDTSMSFSADGKLFAGRSNEQTMSVWDIATRKAILEVPVDSNSCEMTFDSTSTYLAFLDKDKVQVWNLRTKQHSELSQRLNEAGALAFHPTEPYLAVGYRDKKIRIWRVSSPPELLTEIPQDEGFSFGHEPIQFTLDGRFVIRPQGYPDGPSGEFAEVLPWLPDDITHRACDRVIHKNLDTTVWDEYLKGQPYRETCRLP